MCGIAGLIGDPRLSDPSGGRSCKVVEGLSRELSHRGPDDSGIWQDPNLPNVVLGHRRLAILDLSPTGHQPMTSNSGRYSLVLNGEIYNYRKLLGSLSGKYEPKGTSDTEVLLGLIEIYGLREALSRIEGMFAFAVWDREKRTLNLARDRFGEKPLFYGRVGSDFFFTSELRGIRRVFGDLVEIDGDSVVDFFQNGRVGSPRSIYKNISKLPPASFLEVRLDSEQSEIRVSKPVRYWMLDHSSSTSSHRDGESPDYEATLSVFSEKFGEAVEEQMISDVPLGAFLSGGYDSTAVVSAMCERSSFPVNTFTIGFDSKKFDESSYAKEISKHLNTKHTEFRITEQEVLGEVCNIAKKFDEPFADPSQVPTFIVARCASEKVKVCLSGDGGDEVFGGYSRYFQMQKFHDIFSKIPRTIRKVAARAARAELQNPHFGFLNLKLDHQIKAAALLGFDNIADLYMSFTSSQNLSGILSREFLSSDLDSDSSECFSNNLSYMRSMMLHDTGDYLPNTILAKVDRASMSSSLETRAPFLNRQVVEFLWTLPDNFLLPGNGKKLLKDYVHSKVDRSLVERPKAGFSVPLADWLRGPLSEWWVDTVSAAFASDCPWLDQEGVWKLWQQHQNRDRNWHYMLWKVVMFCDWLNKDR